MNMDIEDFEPCDIDCLFPNQIGNHDKYDYDVSNFVDVIFGKFM